MKMRTTWVAGLVCMGLCGLAQAATQLVVPVPSDQVKVKSLTDLPVRFNREALEQLKSGAEVELALPNGSRHLYVYDHSVSHGGGFTTWIARSPLTGTNERAIITYGPHGAWGWMKTTYGDYRIHPSNQGYDLVVPRERMNFAPKFKGGDAREVGPDGPEVAPFKGVPTLAPQPVTKSIFAKVTPSPVVQSDVMILYTTDLAQKLGVGLLPMIYNLITTTNTAYSDSEVAITLRLVNATMIDWPNSNASDDTLDGMNNNSSIPANNTFFQNLTWGGASSLRNIHGADFVALLRDGPTDTGGIGNLPKNPVVYPVATVTSSTAYSVNNFCASGCEGIFAHEVGHNMGNHHDPATIAYDRGGTFDPALSSNQGVFPHSYGYYSCATGLTCNPYVAGPCTGYAECAGNDNNDFGTIMSYFTPKVMKFSNPLLNNCVPAGGNGGAPRACGGSVPAPAPVTTSNNALSMNNVRGAISAYRTQTITNLPGSLQFTALTYAGAEGATITFTVSRANGSSGTASVSYTVTGGTASAGTDYTVANGTLNWADGDSANKTFNVTVATDALVEGVETFTATLSSPTGAPGVYLGYPVSAVGLVLEPWPVGTLGALPTDPTGWSTPASPASSVAWAIANDSAPPGDPDGRSLKSGALNFGVTNCMDGATPVACPSAVEITRTFVGGTVSFAYRLSTVAFFGFFEFLVDGAVVFSTDGDAANAANGGDTGWRNFSTTLAAGNHTLKWQYRTRLPGACTNFLIGGLAYPGCQDRAWIDQLALPLTAGAPPADPPRLVNIATRMQVLTGDDVMIGGFIIGGSAPKTVVVRARGPSMAAQGVPGTLANPLLQLFTGPTQIAVNDNWQTATNQAAIQAAGFHPSNPFESAIMMTLNPGAYTAIVTGVGGTTGVAIVEVFEVDAVSVPLINIATRGRVLTGDNVMIGGFIIQGNGPQTVVVRARGPSMAAQGVPGTLANPQLQLFTGQTVLATNDDWGQATNSAAIQAAGFHPSDSRESAIMMSLAPGAYTAIVSGVGGTTGVAIVEVFTVP